MVIPLACSLLTAALMAVDVVPIFHAVFAGRFARDGHSSSDVTCMFVVNKGCLEVIILVT